MFLDALGTTSDGEEKNTRLTKYGFDPSMYRFRQSLLRTSRASSSTVLRSSRKAGKNVVHLLRQKRTLELPQSDVIMLRFDKRKQAGVAAARTIMDFDEENGTDSPLGTALEGQWSAEMARTLRSARKVALDLTEPWVSELGAEVAYEEIAFLACTLQHDLEVLYLVDNCVGRCTSCGKSDMRAGDLQGKGYLWNCLNYQNRSAYDRKGDVIQAISKKYVEISDFERLGWADIHPSFVFARIIDEAIRSQQHRENQGKFQGVRILVAEDEPLESHATTMHVRCPGKQKSDSILEIAMQLMPAHAGVWNE